MGRSAKLNWLVSDLQKQPMHKPILLGIDGKTITGDTRLWACNILGIETIPALVYQSQPGGVVIKNMVDFYRYTKVPDTSTLDCGPQDADFFTQQVTNYNVYHAEQSDMIGGYDSHRMFVSLEDRHWRTRVMWNWMNQNPGIAIDRSWYLRTIDWRRYY